MSQLSLNTFASYIQDFVSTNHRVHQDFNANFTQKSLEFTDENKPKDDGSWRYFIKYTKPEWEKKKSAI